jgi:hypothetical protein
LHAEGKSVGFASDLEPILFCAAAIVFLHFFEAFEIRGTIGIHPMQILLRRVDNISANVI